MPMSDFESETAVTPIGDGRWSGRVSRHWGIGENPNGGYLVSIALRALSKLSPQHPDPLSVTTHYLRTGLRDQQCEVVSESLRSGRTLSVGRATLMQDGKSRIEVLAAFGDLGSPSSNDTTLSLPPPDIPPPEECIQRSAEEQGVELPLLKRLDIRLHPEEARAGNAGKAQVSGWIRLKDGQPPDSLAAILFADAFPPSVFGLLGVVGWVPTLELTVHVRRRPAPGWILGQFRTSDLADGRMIEDGFLWDSSGHLIVQSRQMALVLSPPNP
jgi:acyl-CoA thioesterase